MARISLGLESLPIELQRNFSLMRDLDNRAQSIMKEIDDLAEDYLKVISQSSTEKRKDQMEKVQKHFNKAKEYGDDKVQLAIQTYELVTIATLLRMISKSSFPNLSSF